MQTLFIGFKYEQLNINYISKSDLSENLFSNTRDSKSISDRADRVHRAKMDGRGSSRGHVYSAMHKILAVI